MNYDVGIVIPILNNFKGAVELMESVKSKEHRFKFYIIDQWIHQGRALSEAWNMGHDRAVADGCKYIFELNDDVLFCPTTLDNAVKEFDRLQPECPLVSLVNVFGEYQNRIEEYKNLQEPYVIPNEVADHPNYSAFLIGADFFDKVGRFDENFKPAWCEDQDSHWRIVLMGYRGVCTSAASCIHFGGVSTAMVTNPDSSHSNNYFRQKWGSKNATPPQSYTHPYNDPNISPKDWIPNYEG